MNKLPITQLIESCIIFFRNHNYTEDRIKTYERYWRNGIVPFMQEKGLILYSSSIGEEYKETCPYEGADSSPNRDRIRAIDVLDDMLSSGIIRKRHTTPIEYHLYGAIGMEMEKFIIHLNNQRRTQSTLDRHRLHLYGFLSSLTNNNISCVKRIAETDIVRYISCRKTDLANCVSTLRSLFRFWSQENITETDFQESFQSIPISKKEKIPSFYTKDEIMQIESSINRSNSLGKRNYAILLLATRLGMRASDIALLKFSNINWDTNSIVLIMKKTNKIIELPLLSDIGNAIIDYLKYGRPQSDSQQIFLYNMAPYKEIKSPAVTTVIATIIQNSSVYVGDRRHGAHSMRHSLAGCLLSNGTTISTISEVLGHKKTQTTMTYLKIDLLSLSKCALPVSSVKDSFYMQKGGIFYV